MQSDIVFGYDIDQYPAEEILEKVGVAKFEDDQLLACFLECLELIKFALEHENRQEQWEACLISSPTACEIYRRFLAHKSTLPKIKPEYLPTSLHFWFIPAAFDFLFRMMVEEGFYKETTHACA